MKALLERTDGQLASDVEDGGAYAKYVNPVWA
jgi:hypothetical protein